MQANSESRPLLPGSSEKSKMERSDKSEAKLPKIDGNKSESKLLKTGSKTLKTDVAGKTSRNELRSAKSQTKSVEWKSEVLKTEGPKRIPPRKIPKKATEDEFAKGPLGFLLTFAWIGLVWAMGLGFGAGVTYLHYLRLGETPLYFGADSFIGGFPRLVFEPNPAHKNSQGKGLISFNPKDMEDKSTSNLLFQYKEIVQKYEAVKDYDLANPEDESSARTPRVLCSKFNGNEDGAPVNTSCLLDLDNDEDFGPCVLTTKNLRHSSMGFAEGEPCIMIRLTKLLGFFPNVPEVLGNSSRRCLLENGPIKRCCHRHRINVTCTGAPYEMFPHDGMDTCAFPFWNQPGYQAPFLMLKFNLTAGLNHVECHSNLEDIEKEKNTMKFKFQMN